MNNFNWTKAIGFGALIWAVMAVVLWALGGINSLSPLWAHGIVAAVGGIMGFVLARNAKPATGMQGAGYGLVWAAMILVLDFAVIQWFDAHIFASWQYWIGPALALVIPWVQTETSQSFTRQTV